MLRKETKRKAESSKGRCGFVEERGIGILKKKEWLGIMNMS